MQSSENNSQFSILNSQFKGVSIVIPTFNGKLLLERFLPSVMASAAAYEQQTQAPTEIIVVDDGSRDETVTWLATTYPTIRCLPQAVNRGFSPTCNIGFQAARFPVIWLLNNDIETMPDALLPLVQNFEESDVFAVGCRAYRLSPQGEHTTDIDGAGRVAEIVRGYWKVYRSYDLLPEYDRLAHDEPLYTMMASGGYAAFDTEKLRQLGGFEELLAPFYWEDAELCYRAWKRGWTVLYEPESLVYHQSSATIAQQFGSKHIHLTATRNRMMVHWIHLHDFRWWLAHLLMTALLLLGDAVTRKFHYWQAFLGLWARRTEVLARRRAERASALRSDRQVVWIIEEVLARPGVATYKNGREYDEFRQRWKRESN